MNTIGQYLSQDNKSTLWSVLYEQGAFSRFGDNEFKSIHNFFEQSLAKSARDIPPNTNLLDANKEFVRNMMQSLSNFSVKRQPITSKDISGQRREEFNDRLKIHEENLKMTINPQKPNDISFADDTDDEPIGGNMDSLLAEKIAQRNLDLDTSSKPNETHTWLDGETAEGEIIPKKKVTFQENTLLDQTVASDTPLTQNEDNLTANLFSKLKTKPTLEVKEKNDSNDEIMKKLNEILERLDRIEQSIQTIRTSD